MDTHRLAFGPFELDTERKLLFKQGAPVAMGQRGLALLEALLAAGGRAVSKAELMDVAWPSQQVEESNLSVQIAALRKSLGPRADGEEWIVTVPRVGYQLIEAGVGVSGRNSRSSQATEIRKAALADTTPVPARSEKGRHVIAVLPFINISGDAEQEYFADGITEDIITDLSKVSGLSVIARQTTYTFKGKPIDVQEICRHLNATSAVEGSVRKSGNRVRINAQLIDAHDGTHVWADRYDRNLNDVFVVQDEITKSIVEQLKVKLLLREKKAIETIPTSSIDAYNYYLQGRHLFHLHTLAHVVIAQRWFKKALELDPGYARAYAGLAYCCWFLYLNDHADSSVADIFAASAKAVQLDPELAEGRAAHGIALDYLGRYPEAVGEFERAIAIDPNLFEAHYFYAMAARQAGDLQIAIRMDERAIDIDPEDNRVRLDLAQCYADAGRIEEAHEMARSAIERVERLRVRHPELSLPLAIGAGALIRLGELSRARQWIAEALMIAPDDPVTLYNVACDFALLNDIDHAMEVLERWRPRANRRTKEWIRIDSDFGPLKSDPRFQTFLDSL